MAKMPLKSQTKPRASYLKRPGSRCRLAIVHVAPLSAAPIFGNAAFAAKRKRASFEISPTRHDQEPALKYQERARRTGTQLGMGTICPWCTSLRSHIPHFRAENWSFSLEAKNALTHIYVGGNIRLKAPCRRYQRTNVVRAPARTTVEIITEWPIGRNGILSSPETPSPDYRPLTKAVEPGTKHQVVGISLSK